jgi:hypothetical protein
VVSVKGRCSHYEQTGMITENYLQALRSVTDKLFYFSWSEHTEGKPFSIRGQKL